jgi:hypothetical protein
MYHERKTEIAAPTTVATGTGTGTGIVNATIIQTPKRVTVKKAHDMLRHIHEKAVRKTATSLGWGTSYFTAALFTFLEHALLALGKERCLGSRILKSVTSAVTAKISKFFGFANLASHTIFFAFNAAILSTHFQKCSPRQYRSQTPLNREESMLEFVGYAHRKNIAMKYIFNPFSVFPFLLN